MRRALTTHPTEKSKRLSHSPNSKHSNRTKWPQPPSKTKRPQRPSHGLRLPRTRQLLGRMRAALIRNLSALAKIFSVAFWKIFWFELVFHVAGALLVLTQTSTVLNFIMKLEHYSFITWELLPAFLSKPPALVCGLVLLVVLALACAFNLSCVGQLIVAARRHKTLPLRSVLWQAVKDVGALLRPSGWPLLLLALVLAPFLNASTMLVVAGAFLSPQLVVEQVFAHRAIAGAFAVATIVAMILATAGMYAYPYYFYQRKSPIQALKLSFRASNSAARHAFVLVGIKLGFDALAVGAMWLIGAGFEWSHTLKLSSDAAALLAGFASGLMTLVFVLVWCLSSPTTQAIVTNGSWELWEAVYGKAKTEHMLVAQAHTWREPSGRLWCNRAAALTLALVLIGSLSWSYKGLEEHLTSWGDLGPAHVSITAHRGASGDHPENTMPAFRAAALERADWIELDVQQSKDGVIFVSHDSNFARISGVDKNAWELSYSEILQLDAGASFAPWWAGTRYPTLEEVIKWAKMSGQYLNIELKPTGHEHGFERAVADIVRKQNYRGYVLLTSQSYPCVQRLKQVAPDISRAYVTNFVYGDLSKLDAMDVWSVKYTSCTRPFVHFAHETGRPVLAWTCNTESAMLYAINNGVDGIITNHVDLARKAIADSAATAQVRTLYDIAMTILFG